MLHPSKASVQLPAPTILSVSSVSVARHATFRVSGEKENTPMPRAHLRVESPLGAPGPALEPFDLPDRIRARELIRTHVREEVSRYDLDGSLPFQGLVAPTAAERSLNTESRRAEWPALDWEEQADLAERAFEKQRFVLVVGDRQMESLEENIDLTGEPEIVFVKLIPLAGG